MEQWGIQLGPEKGQTCQEPWSKGEGPQEREGNGSQVLSRGNWGRGRGEIKIRWHKKPERNVLILNPPQKTTYSIYIAFLII